MQKRIFYFPFPVVLSQRPRKLLNSGSVKRAVEYHFCHRGGALFRYYARLSSVSSDARFSDKSCRVFRRREEGRKEGRSSKWPSAASAKRGGGGGGGGRRKYPSVIKWLVRFESGDGDQSINPGETSGGPCNSMDYATSTLQQSSSSLSRESSFASLLLLSRFF